MKVYIVTIGYSRYKHDFDSDDIISFVCTTHAQAERAMRRACRRQYKSSLCLEEDHHYFREFPNLILWGEGRDEGDGRRGYREEFGYGKIEECDVIEDDGNSSDDTNLTDEEVEENE